MEVLMAVIIILTLVICIYSGEQKDQLIKEFESDFQNGYATTLRRYTDYNNALKYQLVVINKKHEIVKVLSDYSVIPMGTYTVKNGESHYCYTYHGYCQIKYKNGDHYLCDRKLKRLGISNYYSKFERAFEIESHYYLYGYSGNNKALIDADTLETVILPKYKYIEVLGSTRIIAYNEVEDETTLYRLCEDNKIRRSITFNGRICKKYVYKKQPVYLYCVIKDRERNEYLYGYLNYKFKIIIPAKYESVTPIDDDGNIFTEQENSYKAINIEDYLY